MPVLAHGSRVATEKHNQVVVTTHNLDHQMEMAYEVIILSVAKEGADWYV